MKRFKDVDEALALFEYYVKKGCDALNRNGDSKTANKCQEAIGKIIAYLKCNESVYMLERFHNHSNIEVRMEAALYTLPLDEEKSLKVLKKIVKSGVKESFEAEWIIRRWKKEDLKPFLIRLCTNQQVPEKKIKRNALKDLKELICRVLINVGLVTCKEHSDREK